MNTLTMTSCSVKKKVCAKITLAWTKAKPFVEKQSESLNKTCAGKLILATACSTVKKANVICEKVLGKEKMQACIAKVQGFVPCTPAPLVATKPQPKDVPQKKIKKDGPADKAA